MQTLGQEVNSPQLGMMTSNGLVNEQWNGG